MSTRKSTVNPETLNVDEAPVTEAPAPVVETPKAPVEVVDVSARQEAVSARQEVAALTEAVKALKYVDTQALADVVARLERVERAVEKSVGFPK